MKDPDEITEEELMAYLSTNGVDAIRLLKAQMRVLEIRKRAEMELRIEQIESALKQLIAWSVRELGESATKELLAELNAPTTNRGSENE
jgi:hypothetical protein